MSRDGNFACGIHPAAQIAIGEQQWVTGFHCVWSVAGWLIAPRWQSISIQANIVRPSVNKKSPTGHPKGRPWCKCEDYDDTFNFELGNIKQYIPGKLVLTAENKQTIRADILGWIICAVKSHHSWQEMCVKIHIQNLLWKLII